MDKFSRDNLNLVTERITSVEGMRGYDLPFGVIANKVKKSKGQIGIFKDLVFRHDYPFLSTCILASEVIPNAESINKPVMKHRKNSKSAKDFSALATELMGGVING